MRAGSTWADVAATVAGGMGRLWRRRLWTGRRRLACRAASSLSATLPQLRADIRDATTSADRAVAVARWRSRWMFAAAMIDLADPAAARAVRVSGRRLYRHLMKVEVLGTAWPVGGIRRDSADRIETTARATAHHCCPDPTNPHPRRARHPEE